MSIEDKVKAAAKNIEGKVQEAIGEVTGNPKDRAEGQAKQSEAEARNMLENVKNKAKEIIN